MAFGDQDLDVFFADFGVSVIFAGTAARGNFDTPSDSMNFGGGPSGLERQQYMLSLPASAFARLLTNGDSVMVDGAPYKVKSRDLSLDGLIVTYAMDKV